MYGSAHLSFAPRTGDSAGLNAESIALFDAARRIYLDALPIPTAIVEVTDGVATLSAHNERYAEVDALATNGLLTHPALTDAVLRFVETASKTVEFDWTDGDDVQGHHYRIRIARLFDLAEGTKRLLLSALDRTAEVESHRSLRAEMTHDSLTGLPNRTAFCDALGEAVDAVASIDLRDAEGGRGAGPGLAVLIVDLARFSRVNECLGSLVGDELIITVARRLLSTVRQGEMLARIGGNEFAILVRLDPDGKDVMGAAQRIQCALSTPFHLSEMEIRVDCAIGCAVPDGQRPAQGADLFRNAQFAVKRAKASGRIELYQPGEVNAVRRRFSLETELRRAIDGDRLTLAYQPLIDLRTGGISGYEALARWDDPQHGPIGPAEFIPVAEESGLILPLGRWAIETAARTLAEWDRKAGRTLPFNVCVNLSAVQLQRDDVSAAIHAVQARHKVAGRLKLELTESCIVADPERAMRVLNELKEQDVRIAMDDFGTGYSSLAYLQRLPIDELKIDRSFVIPMLRDRDSLAIVRAVLSLAAALGMSTTAEGVETYELGETLAALGCTLGQGWHYARPLAAEDAYAYWVERSGLMAAAD
jgi:diguanylate cyclase (GGDEF)-like protein